MITLATGEAATRRIAVIAAVHPLTAGAAPFNGALVTALEELGPVDVLSWRRMYPPLLDRGGKPDVVSEPPRTHSASFSLDWLDPRTWRRALDRVACFRADALVLPWLHPVMTPPYRWFLRHVSRRVRRVVICHNVKPHESFPGAAVLTRSTLRHADLLVTHAPHQRHELAELGVDVPVLEAFHPRFVAADLAAPPSREAVRQERERLGNPGLLLLQFGAVRRYKGLDVALEALALTDPSLSVRLVVAGRFWDGAAEYRRLADGLGIGNRVVIRDGYASNEEAAVLFSASDVVVLPYRSASQSGVAQLAFAYGRPVIASAVGGLPAAVRHDRDGILCEPGDAAALARAIERMASERERLAATVQRDHRTCSFRSYAEGLHTALGELAA
jgi:glycosyltransferase involved in cell wall biosynthesis